MDTQRLGLRAIGLVLILLASAGCQVLETEQTPTAPAASPFPQPTVTVILPTPPPPATLTALVEAYRQTREPRPIETPTDTPRPGETPSPTVVVESPTPIGGASVVVVPELAEPRQSVEVRGTGWLPGEEVALGLGPSVENATMVESRVVAQADGTFATTLAVPADWAGDNAVIVAQSADGQRRAVARLYLVTPTKTVPPTPIPSPTAVPAATPTTTFVGWRGEYYANTSLRGEPVLVRDDRVIDFDWGHGAPADEVPIDAFSVRWTQTIDFLPGGYEFSVEVDDGVRVYIDGDLVLDEWRVTSKTTYDFQRVFDGGPTDVRVEYYDAGGEAMIRFEWRFLGRYPEWRGAYYDNQTLSGSPVLIRNDAEIDFNWEAGSPAPQVPADNFSVRWTRFASFDAGTHRFQARADDGVRVWVDSSLIIDEWHVSSGGTVYTTNIYLSRGNHDIRVEYYEAGGNAEVHVWWENLDAYADWRGAYYDNRSLSGAPAVVRNDPTIDFNWGKDGPDDVGPDNFSVRWRDDRGFSEAAVYQFFAEHDDGVRIWINDKLILDKWGETGPVTDRQDVELTAGTHEIRVDYFEASGDARIRVWWEVAPYR